MVFSNPERLALWFVAAFALFLWFLRLERRGDRHTIFVVVALTYLVEGILGGHAPNTSVGLLRPEFFGQDFRIEDVVIVVMLAARAFGRTGRGYIPSGMFAVSAFGLWYATSVVIGLMNHLAPVQVLYQGKALFYVIGGIVAAAGVDPERLARQIGRLAPALAGVVVVATLLGFLKLKFAFSLPLQPFTEFGVLSNDTATALVIIGALVLLVEAVRETRRPGVVLSGVLLLLAPLAGDHRASYLVLGWVIVALLATVVGKTWRRRSRVSRGKVALILGGLLLVATGVFAFTSAPAVVLDRLHTAFSGDATSRSAQSRVVLTTEAAHLIAERPLVGWGVGKEVSLLQPYTREEVSAAAHNVLADVALRSGLIGLGLFVLALAATTRVGVRRWRVEASDRVAAVCLAATIGVLGVTVKSMVEPSFDKYRLSLLVGIGIGLILLAARLPEPRTAGRARGRSSAAPLPGITQEGMAEALVGDA